MPASFISVGPFSLPRDRIDYIGAISMSWKEQTSLDIVRLRNADAPVFLDVPSVINSYTLQAQVAATGQMTIDAPGSFVNPETAGLYLDKRTITHTLLTGDQSPRACCGRYRRRRSSP